MTGRWKKILLLLLVLLLTARVILPQLDTLQESLQALKQADMNWIVLGVVLYFSGIFVLAIQFLVLALKKLAFALTVRVQGATLFANKILPNGVGTISLNLYYFIKKGHTPNQATAVVTVNAICSTAAYAVLIVLALLFSQLSLDGLIGSVSIPLNAVLFVLLLATGAAVVLLHSHNLRQKIAKTLVTFKQNIGSYRKRPHALIIATVLNGLGSSLNVLTLMASAKAIGVDISFADALLAYTFGNIAAALVPTPGGIGSAEMGIYSGLMLVGLGSDSAISITLLYRLITYWLPILPGYYFFWSLRKSIFSDYTFHSAKHPSTPKTA